MPRYVNLLDAPRFLHVAKYTVTGGSQPYSRTHIYGRKCLNRGRSTWTRCFVIGASSGVVAYGLGTGRIGSVIYADAPRNEDEEYVRQPELEPANDPLCGKESTWKGLDFLRSSLSATALASVMSTWKWPTSLDFTSLQAQLSALFLELSMGPGSLYSEIVDSPPDPKVYPEVDWDAEVRFGQELCMAERAFIGERRRAMRAPFANLIGVPESDIDERDLPIVAVAGSGGGYRAMLNTIGSLIGAESAGILSCVSYTAGVSGSCWALGVLHSGVAGLFQPKDAAAHLKDRIQLSYLDRSTLDALVTPPTHKYLLSGILRKAAAPSGAVSLVDVYGTLLGSRLFVPSDLSKLNPQDLSLHLMRRGIDRGQRPMPIFTAVQHATPPVAVQAIRELQAKRITAVDEDRAVSLDQEKIRLADATRCLWYEFTPYEIGCDEIGAWIPSWSFGRQFRNGLSVERRPELGFTILAGVFGSAFCASLKHYFAEIQPTLEVLPSQLFRWLREIITENERDFGLIHPVLPDQVPNFLKGLDGQLRYGSPPDLADREYMSFMDAGAELNLPYYPLLRRNVDCIIALDASADSQDLWFTRAEELAAKRGLRTWPKGTGWPVAVQPQGDANAAIDRNAPGASPTSDTAAQAATRKLAETQESELAGQSDKQDSATSHDLPQGLRGSSDSEVPSRPPSIRPCEVWIGSSESNEEDSSRLDDLDEDALLMRDGIGVVYIPLAPNERTLPGFDPFAISTWRREVTAEESQALLDVAQANFEDSREKIVRLLRAIWLRKKHTREQKEWQEHFIQFRKNLRQNLL